MINAKVDRVVDGDTFDVTAKFRVRMDFIDAPEKTGVEKPKGVVSFQHLKERIEGLTVKLDVKKFDTYDRALCVVYIDGENINAEMVKSDLAEIYSPRNHNNAQQD